jgi:hypothetical protein
MMLPTPAKTFWSSSASQTSVSGIARSFRRAATASHASESTSALQS